MVTGAARGIGAATAVAMARFGADVAVFDKDPTLLPEVVACIEAASRRCVFDVLDARDDDAVAAFMQRTHDELGAIHVIVNNAGGTFRARFDDTSPKGEHTLIRENFSTVTNCVRHGVPLMSDGGAIINVTSVEAYHAAPMFGGVRGHEGGGGAVHQDSGLGVRISGHPGQLRGARHDADSRRLRAGRAGQFPHGGPASHPRFAARATPTSVRR